MFIGQVKLPDAVTRPAASIEISLRARLEPVSDIPEEDVHYQLTIDGKPVYYLQDMPKISFFSHTLVDVKGAVILNPHKKFTYPLLHINKISLVL